MQLAMIGMGRMGGNMATRLALAGHQVTAFDVDFDTAASVAADHHEITPVSNLTALITALPAPRTIWMMVPHQAVDATIHSLLESGLESDDLIVDGGNSNYREGQRRSAELKKRGIHFSDCGTSGGVWGLKNGYSLMIGGCEAAIDRLAPALTSLAANDGKAWAHVGPAGAGHFVKMVHNGIEYGMMQAFAEGFELMHAKTEFNLDIHQIARAWQKGSVVSSWLLDLTAEALQQDGDLSSLSDWMDDSGEGRWTANESVELGIPTPVMTLALQMRFRSRQDSSMAGKVVNAMRAGFGGHPIKPTEKQ